jgi:dolichol kinase
LILGLSDGLAGLIGQKIGRRSYRITGHKTAEGSFIFFIITSLIFSGLLVYNQSPIGSEIIVAALLLTLVEGAVSKGWDNLPISLLGGLAIYLLL